MIEFKTIRHSDAQEFTESVQRNLNEGWGIRDLDTVPSGNYGAIYHIAYLTRVRP